MERRALGNSGLRVSPLAFGGNVFGWTVDESTSFKLLDSFVAEGFNLIDTADVYTNWKPGNMGGESETIIGKWLKRSGARDQVAIATKVGHEMGLGGKGLKKEHILRSAEDSLRRLQTDHIDLYQSHKDDPETPIEETLEAYGQLIAQGKVRAIGASNFGPERLAESLRISKKDGLPSYTSLQPPYNLYDRADFENQLMPLCAEQRLGVICYYSLSSGFLTGKYRSDADLSKSPRGSRVKRYLTERGFRILQALDQVSSQLNTKPATVAIAWLISRPCVTAPIASATSLAQLSELIESTRLTLGQSQIDLLDKASS